MCYTRRHTIPLQRRVGQWQKIGVSQWADRVAVHQAVVAGHWDGDWHLKVGRWDSLWGRNTGRSLEVRQEASSTESIGFAKENSKFQVVQCVDYSQKEASRCVIINWFLPCLRTLSLPPIGNASLFCETKLFFIRLHCLWIPFYEVIIIHLWYLNQLPEMTVRSKVCDCDDFTEKRGIKMQSWSFGLIAYWSIFMQKFNDIKSSSGLWIAHIV